MIIFGWVIQTFNKSLLEFIYIFSFHHFELSENLDIYTLALCETLNIGEKNYQSLLVSSYFMRSFTYKKMTPCLNKSGKCSTIHISHRFKINIALMKPLKNFTVNQTIFNSFTFFILNFYFPRLVISQ